MFLILVDLGLHGQVDHWEFAQLLHTLGLHTERVHVISMPSQPDSIYPPDAPPQNWHPTLWQPSVADFGSQPTMAGQSNLFLQTPLSAAQGPAMPDVGLSGETGPYHFGEHSEPTTWNRDPELISETGPFCMGDLARSLPFQDEEHLPTYIRDDDTEGMSLDILDAFPTFRTMSDDQAMMGVGSIPRDLGDAHLKGVPPPQSLYQTTSPVPLALPRVLPTSTSDSYMPEFTDPMMILGSSGAAASPEIDNLPTPSSTSYPSCKFGNNHCAHSLTDATPHGVKEHLKEHHAFDVRQREGHKILCLWRSESEGSGCNKAYTNLHSLAQHVATYHFRSTTVQCQHCKTSYCRPDALKRHIIRGCGMALTRGQTNKNLQGPELHGGTTGT